eukprot:2796976-Prymnesium_polylepis.2
MTNCARSVAPILHVDQCPAPLALACQPSILDGNALLTRVREPAPAPRHKCTQAPEAELPVPPTARTRENGGAACP